MLEPLVGPTRINEVCQGQLVNMTQSLKGRRIKNFPFIRIQSDENMDGISYFMRSFADHRSTISYIRYIFAI